MGDITHLDSLDRDDLVPVPGAVLWTRTSGRGRPLVLCHGGPGLSDNLGEVALMVNDLAQVHRYDQRGGGRSRSTGPLGLAEHTGDLDALREHWGHERWTVGGHSWGALLALLYALEHPRRTSGVVCICAGNAWHHLDRNRPGPRNASVLTEAERAELADLGTGDARRLHLIWLANFADRAAGEAVLARGPLYGFERNDEVVRAVGSDLRTRIGRDFDRELAGLEVPVLVLHGDEDHNLLAAERLARVLPRPTLRILSRTAHVPWLEDPAGVRAALRNFMDNLPEP
jgi:proline iminopeptidase